MSSGEGMWGAGGAIRNTTSSHINTIMCGLIARLDIMAFSICWDCGHTFCCSYGELLKTISLSVPSPTTCVPFFFLRYFYILCYYNIVRFQVSRR